MGDYEREQRQLEMLMEDALNNESEPLVYDDEVDEDEEDHLETDHDSSDTEQEFEVGDDLEVNPEIHFMGKDKKTVWKKHVPPKNVKTRAKNIIKIKLPSVKPDLRELKEPLKIWRQFFDDDILNLIVVHTNEYLQSVADEYGRATYTRPTDKLEIEALLGLLIFAGVAKGNHTNAENLFRTNGTSPDIYRLTMSLQRFRILLRFIRFDDIATRDARRALDKLAPIRELFEKFVTNCKKNFNLSQQVTVDEKLEAFRGRCGFRQYMPLKPNKYGIKIFALCDAKLFYTYNLEVYVGNQPEGPFAKSNSAMSVVKRLTEPIYGSNRNVTTDRWFTSIELAKELLSKGLTTIGTIRANKRELPPEFVQKNSRPIGSSMFGFKQDCTLVSYIPKRNKNVLLISTCHDDNQINLETGKPEIIMDYNATKSGVDTVDQLASNYNCARTTRRWQMAVFYSLLNISGINSQVIYSINKKEKIVRRHFLENLALSLIDGHLRVRANSNYLPKLTRLRICEICRIEPSQEPHDERRNLLGRCVPCGSKKNRKTKYCCKTCNQFLCMEHVTITCARCYELQNTQEQ